MPREAASGLWRSEDMSMLQLHMQRETAHDTVLKLGQLGMMQFMDLNKGVNAFQRNFSTAVRRCDDMERKLRYFEEQLAKTSIVAVPVETAERETLDSLERKIEERDADLREISTRYEQLLSECNRTREYTEVLRHDRSFIEGDASEMTERGTSRDGLGYITGVMPTARISNFERLVFRATRGNSFIRVDPIAEPFNDPLTNDTVEKSVFVAFFSAQRAHDKIKKLCESMGATSYPYVEGPQLDSTRASLRQQATQLEDTVRQTQQRMTSMLNRIAGEITDWKRAVQTEKGVYSVLNMLEFKGGTVKAIGWAPTSEIDNVRTAVRRAEAAAGAQVNTIVEEMTTKEKPPTYFKTNRITASFQGIVDSYGIARYKEVNPGVLTIVTFPYLFGVMYGDLGHGLILTIFAAFLIFMEKNFEGKPLNEIFALIFGGRYLLFLMGIFATYVGILYNDMFGIQTEMFASGYSWPDLPPNGPAGVVYPNKPNLHNIKPAEPVKFGVDAAWAETENKLEFYNSMKMKCAVIIGVVQMTVGLFLSLGNHLYFKDFKHVFFGFIPELIFLMFTFGYMCLMILIKWIKPWPGTNDAPSLLATMTNFFLQPGYIEQPLYAGQGGIQVFLLLVAFAMVPVLLCVIPYLEKKHHNDRMKANERRSLMPEDEDEHEDDDDYHFDFSEIVIHQVIHTIEFVLGCVSNTASYLRLWALSLAHAELSDVFWNFAFMMTVGLDKGSGIFVFIGFAVWLAATIGVLLTMESLSAFLHALRLHWVEFQNKFYYGDGVKFAPFDLAEILESA